MTSNTDTATPFATLPPPPLMRYVDIDIPASPDFSFLDNDNEIIESAYKIIQANEAWELLRNFSETSFMFSRNHNIINLMYKINDAYPGHSGGSLGGVMRDMQFISKNGFSKYKSRFL